MDIVLAYDIADTDGPGASRLRRICHVCEKYGERVQYSVFECRLSPTRFERMMGEIQDVVDLAVDSVIVYQLPGGLDVCRSSFGKKPNHDLGKPWIV